MMSYCGDLWISDYTYLGLANRVSVVDGSVSMLTSAPRRRWLVAISGPGGLRWVAAPDRTRRALGEAEPATILDGAGNPIAQVTVYRARMDHLNSASIMVPRPLTGWHAVVLAGQPPLAFGTQHSNAP
jgi:hypothetical protein